MSLLEKLLAENMQRFGTKNLNETQKHRITQLLLEQTNTYEEPDAQSGNYLQRNVPSAEWQIDGFTAPEINNMSAAGRTTFKNAYRTYMDLSTGMVGKTLIVFKNATSIDDCVFDPKNVHLRIVIQSTYVPGPKAKDVAALGWMGQEGTIKIWSSKQATRNFDLATKTVMRKSDPETLGSDSTAYLQSANISALITGMGSVEDPTNGYVNTKGAEYTLGMKGEVRQGGVLVGYAPINFDTDSVHKTEGWGTILTTKGFAEKLDAWY